MKSRILLIDDDPLLINLLTAMLHTEGYEVIAAYDGQDGLRKAFSEAPDLIILDIMMPIMDGYEVCRRLKTNPATTDINVLMLSAKGNVNATDGDRFSKALDEQLAGFDVGALEFMSKPVSRNALLKRVKFLLWMDGAATPDKQSGHALELKNALTPTLPAKDTEFKQNVVNRVAPSRQSSRQKKAKQIHHPDVIEKPKRVLVVDDDAMVVRIVELALQRRGYEVFSAANGLNGLEMARTMRPALIILDVMMPGMDGYEVCRRLKGDPETERIDVLMFTAVGNQAIHRQNGTNPTRAKEIGLEAGADDFLSKPIVVKELVERVDQFTQPEKRGHMP